MKKKAFLAFATCALALGATALIARNSLEAKADANLGLGLVGGDLEIDGVATTNWDKDNPIKSATLEDGFYTLTVNFSSAAGKFKFATTNGKWFGLADTEKDGSKYLNVDKRWFDWGVDDGNNIYVKTAGTYTFKFSKSTIDNTSDGGDIFRQNESSVSKAATGGESYIYFSLGTYYNTEAWYDHTVYLYSYTGETKELGAWPGAKAEPVGYGLYRVLHSGLGGHLIVNAATTEKKGQLEIAYGSENFIEFADNYSATGLTYGQIGSIAIADYFIGTVTKSCDSSGEKAIDKGVWGYLSNVSRILGNEPVESFAACTAEVVAGKSHVLQAKERYSYIINNPKYVSYDDYFGLRTSNQNQSLLPNVGYENTSNKEAIMVTVIGLSSVVLASGFILLRKKKEQ